jgi:L-malate glycosyltransferase
MDSFYSPRLCFVGNMLGLNPGFVTTQGQIAADLFAKEGYQVIKVSSKISRPFRFLDIIQTIYKNSRSIDVMILEVYSGTSMVLADSASFLCKLFGIPLVSVLHGGDLPAFIKRFPRWTRRVLTRADMLVAPSNFLASEMKRLNFPVRIIPNILDLNLYPFKLREKIFPKLIWMRSFHPIYNPQLAISAFSLIKKKRPEATLVMAGADKGLESEIKEMARQMGLEESIRFPGFLSVPDKIREFSEADIYLNTNKIDNMPVSVIEACAMGLPVVATNVGGISHLLSDRKNGLLVADNNALQMANAVTGLLDDSELAAQISKNGRLLAEESSWDTVRGKWEELFSRLLTEKQRKK